MIRTQLSAPDSSSLRRRSVVAPLAGALVALLCASGATAQTEVSRRVAAAADGTVTVSNISGSVVVRGWDREEVEVTGTLGRSVERLRLDSVAGRVDVEVELPRRSHNDGDADLEIRVPRGSRLELELVSARAAVADLSGDVRVETVSGSIEVTGAARAVELESVSGSIEVDSRSRLIDAETVSGSIYVVGALGEVAASTVSGSIEITGDKLSRLRLESVSGTIELAGSLAPRADVEIECHSGSVEIELPAAVSARFEISTYSGRIRNDFGPEAQKVGRYTPESQLEFTAGGGDGRVRIETFSGRVDLRRR